MERVCTLRLWHPSHSATSAVENSLSRRRYMSPRNLLRKVFLCIALGGHSIFGVGMSHEKIEELLHAMHQTRIEVTISDDDETNHAPGPLDVKFSSKSAKQLSVEKDP